MKSLVESQEVCSMIDHFLIAIYLGQVNVPYLFLFSKSTIKFFNHITSHTHFTDPYVLTECNQIHLWNIIVCLVLANPEI